MARSNLRIIMRYFYLTGFLFEMIIQNYEQTVRNVIYEIVFFFFFSQIKSEFICK